MDYSDLNTELADTNINMSSEDNNDTFNNNKNISEDLNIKESYSAHNSKELNNNTTTTTSKSIRSNFFSSIFESRRKELATNISSNLLSSAKEKTKKWYEKLICNFTFLEPYFSSLTTKELFKRLKYSLIPFNKSYFKNTLLFKDKNNNNNNDDTNCVADLYGPYWILTTLMFIVSACTSITSFCYYGKFLDESNKNNNFVELLPNAGFLFYSLFLLFCIVFCFVTNVFIAQQDKSKSFSDINNNSEEVSFPGSDSKNDSTISNYVINNFTYINVLCVFGYSLVSLVPATLICIIPISYIQQIVIIVALIISFSIVYNCFGSILSILPLKKRYLSYGIVFIFYTTIYFYYNYYFLIIKLPIIIDNNYIKNNIQDLKSEEINKSNSILNEESLSNSLVGINKEINNKTDFLPNTSKSINIKEETNLNNNTNYSKDINSSNLDRNDNIDISNNSNSIKNIIDIDIQSLDSQLND